MQGPDDAEIPFPLETATLGQVDAAAKPALAAALQAVGVAGTQGWQSLSATGEITYPPLSDGSSSETDPATLTISNPSGSRLDVTRPTGVQSTRMDGSAGAIFYPDGTTSFLPRKTAAYGLLPFVLLYATSFPPAGSSLFECGTVSVGGGPLQCIGYERLLSPGLPTISANILVTDFYFDSATHLLVKSAELIRPPTSSGMGLRGPFLQVTTYGDYRQVDGLLLPFSFSRTLDGELVWTLQLDQITLNQSIPASEFSLAEAQP